MWIVLGFGLSRMFGLLSGSCSLDFLREHRGLDTCDALDVGQKTTRSRLTTTIIRVSYELVKHGSYVMLLMRGNSLQKRHWLQVFSGILVLHFF